MTKYNFDEIIDRKKTDSLKYRALKERFGREDLLPLWVADMDFKSPPALIASMTERVQHGIFGYPIPSEDYYQAIINWQKKHQWEITKEEIEYIPGIVKGIAFAIETFTNEKDKIIIQSPVYHPFKNIPTLHNREIINNPLKLNGAQYEMDFEHLENIMKENNCKMMILCNPHNPGGRVWSKEELQKVAELCHSHNVLVISDEIHSDLTFTRKHTPFASVSDKAAQISITFNAPSKTFNIAGLVSSYSIIKNKEIRDKFHSFLVKNELNEGTIFAYSALQAVYENGEDWLVELKKYLWDNIQFVESYIKTHIPQIKIIIPEASFLIWLDCREFKLSQKELVSFFINDAHLALNDGAIFGKEGIGFMRMNVGCSRDLLQQALDQLKNACNKFVFQ